MGERTKISFAHRTFSPWIGCTKVSEGCTNCYAEVSTPARAFKVGWGSGKERRMTMDWGGPVRWNKIPWYCKQCGRFFAAKELNWGFCPVCGTNGQVERTRVFFSLGDPFDEETRPGFLTQFLELIFKTPELDWLLFTKRIDVAGHGLFQAGQWELENPSPTPGFRAWLQTWIHMSGVPCNVWIIASMENRRAQERLQALAGFPAAVRGISAEPMLGLVNPDFAAVPGRIHWIIFGGESHRDSYKARACWLEWIDQGVRNAEAHGVLPFVKQMGTNSICANVNAYEFPEGTRFIGAEGPEGAVAGARVRYRHPKGGEPSEWPEEFRKFGVPVSCVRQSNNLIPTL